MNNLRPRICLLKVFNGTGLDLIFQNASFMLDTPHGVSAHLHIRLFHFVDLTQLKIESIVMGRQMHHPLINIILPLPLQDKILC